MKIDVLNVIEKCKLDPKEVAKQLFPDNKYPKLALNRVLSGDSFLDSEQISKLAMLAGVSVTQLYTSGWKTQNKKNTIIFTNDSYRVELNTETWVSKIFDKESMFHESVLSSKFIPISEYLAKVKSIINKHNKNGKIN